MKTCVRFQIEKSSIKDIRSCRIKHNLHIQLRTTSGSGETEESAEHVIPAGLWSHCHPVTGMLEWKDTGSSGRAGRGDMEEVPPSLSVTSWSAWISSLHGDGWGLWGQDEREGRDIIVGSAAGPYRQPHMHKPWSSWGPSATPVFAGRTRQWGIGKPGISGNAFITSFSKWQMCQWGEVLCWTLFFPTRRCWWGR